MTMRSRPDTAQQTYTLTPPKWVIARKTIREWASIAHVQVIGYQEEGARVSFTVAGAVGDVDIFGRIVVLNTKGW
jgi:hypothetical protein